MTTRATSPFPQTPDEMVAQLQEIARLAEIKGQYSAALKAQRMIAELQGLLPARPRRTPMRKAPPRELTPFEAADAIAKTVKP